MRAKPSFFTQKRQISWAFSYTLFRHISYHFGMTLKRKEAMDSKKVLFLTVKYAFFFLLFYISGRASVLGLVFPFAFGMLFSLVWCNQKPLYLAPLYVVASYLATLQISSLYYALATAGVMLLTYGIHYRLRKPMQRWLIGLYGGLSQVFFMVWEIVGGASIFHTLAGLLLGLLFLYACLHIFEAILVRGFVYRLTNDELICAYVVLLCFGAGLSSLNIGGFECYKLVSVLLICSASHVMTSGTGLLTAGVLGLGGLIHLQSPIYLCVFVVWAMSLALFKVRNRIFPCLSVLAAEAALGWFFEVYGGYGILQFAPVIAGSLLFLALPGKVMDKVAAFFTANQSRTAMRDIVNRNKDMCARRLLELSDVFGEMNKLFRGMMKHGMTEEEAKTLLFEDIRNSVCGDCPERHRCHRTSSEQTEKVMGDLISIAFQKGKVNLLDLPPFLTAHCPRLNPLVNTLNQQTAQYKKYVGYLGSLDSSKLLVAEQMQGVSQILYELGADVRKNVTFNSSGENKIMDELTSHNIVCSDVVVYDEGVDSVSVTLVVRTEDAGKPSIEKVTGKILKHPFTLERMEESKLAGWQILTLRSATKYDVVFGTAACTKATAQVSGDSYSILRMEGGKCMLALCDGMGSGERAEQASKRAMGLIENFYKAGFSSDIILSSVNRLLTLGNQEDVFSALDLCVIDLHQGIADSIKLGAPCGLLKHRHEVDVLTGGSLPIGIVGELTPAIKKLVLSEGDQVVLCTDGVTDAFASDYEFAVFVNEQAAGNPQVLAEKILQRALESNGGTAVDDMTVLVAKVFAVNGK